MRRNPLDFNQFSPGNSRVNRFLHATVVEDEHFERRIVKKCLICDYHFSFQRPQGINFYPAKSVIRKRIKCL